MPHQVPANAAQRTANWNYIKRSIEGIVNDGATQRENLNVLKSLQQEDRTINEYLAIFKSYLKRTKKNALYEQGDPDIVDEVIEIFIQGLDPSIVMPGGPYATLEEARDAAVSVMKYNKRRGTKDKIPEEVPDADGVDYKKKYEKLKRDQEKKQLEQFIQEIKAIYTRHPGQALSETESAEVFRLISAEIDREAHLDHPGFDSFASDKQESIRMEEFDKVRKALADLQAKGVLPSAIKN